MDSQPAGRMLLSGHSHATSGIYLPSLSLSVPICAVGRMKAGSLLMPSPAWGDLSLQSARSLPATQSTSWEPRPPRCSPALPRRATSRPRLSLCSAGHLDTQNNKALMGAGHESRCT